MKAEARARFLRIVVAAFVAGAIGVSPPNRVAASSGWLTKLDPLLQQRVLQTGRSQVVLRGPANPAALSTILPSAQRLGGRLIRTLPILNGAVLDVPNAALSGLAANPLVEHLSLDRLVSGANERTRATVGATAVRQELGYDGAGVGIAVIDSGITSWHDDLTNSAHSAQRVDRFVDFVNGRHNAYDDYGHGTHVAGIAAGNGFDSSGARSGIAPRAHLTVLKVLDASGSGRISDVVAALDYAVSNKDELHIRVINLSVATGVYESYNADPLTLAAQRAVAAGIVVVAAAGNNGRSAIGTTQYAGVTAPGNAPWVLTVGASSHMGTIDRSDDTMAAFSSRGPGAIDFGAKPDLVAPGVGIESLSNPVSALYSIDSEFLLNGTVPTSYLPYLSLTGTSMSTPVVSGTVALMLQANPSLTPNAVKAVLQYTAQVYPGYDRPDGDRIAWGIICGNAACDPSASAPWQTSDVSLLPNVVWGSMCGGANCPIPWTVSSVTATSDPEADTVVWGTSDTEGDTVVWGTSCADPGCQPVLWKAP